MGEMSERRTVSKISIAMVEKSWRLRREERKKGRASYS